MDAARPSSAIDVSTTTNSIRTGCCSELIQFDLPCGQQPSHSFGSSGRLHFRKYDVIMRRRYSVVATEGGRRVDWDKRAK